jgi:glycosyltransferase involved in cell wall biosynthesis
MATNASIQSPLVSIITVVFNARSVLPELLDSVLKLKNPHIELIVVDAGSKDRTVEFLQQHNSLTWARAHITIGTKDVH